MIKYYQSRNDNMERKKKLRCPNCGTVIKDNEKSCSICHMLVERPKDDDDDEEKEFVVKEEFPVMKVVMLVFIFIGIVLTIKGIVEFQNSEYCRQDDCEVKSLFMAGVGIILIISASVAVARDEKKFKKA